jgi:PAS domain S-box-containing protein
LAARELRILILEDNPADAELVEYNLREAGIAFASKLVETGEEFREALVDFSPGLILSDYDLPGFSGRQALQIAKENCPDVPFILVTGAIGEESAIEILTSGATDYVLKNRLSRLAPAVMRALQEVRERKEREKAQLRFKTLVEQIPAVTYIFRPNQHSGYSYEYVSPQSKSMTGISPAEFLADPDLFAGNIHPEDKDSVMKEFALSRLEQKPFCSEYRFIHSDGRIVWLRDESIPVKGDAGNPSYFQGILTDITALKETEEDLRRAHDNLEMRVRERTEELEDFTSSVSHDLRGPVWMLENYISILIEDYGGKLDPDLEGRLRTIWKTVKHMNQLIDDLLSLSRVNRTEISIVPIDLNEIVNDAWEEICSLNAGSDILFTVKDLPAAAGDRNLIRQVVYNLLSNSVKFSKNRKRPEIEVGGSTDGESSIFYVRDNGAGFDMKQSHKLFGIFQRLHGAKFEGTGVGLAIVQRIVQRHGGYVKAEGKMHKGATFLFSIPAKCSQR